MRVAPGPSRWSLLWSWPALAARPLDGLVAIWRAHGDVVRVPLGRDYFLVADPAAIRRVLKDHRTNYDKATSFDDLRLLIGDGLLTARNDAWVEQRRLLAKAFVSRAVAAEADAAVRAAEALGAAWRADLGARREMARLVSADFARLTLALSSTALLGADASGEAEALGRAFANVSTGVSERMRALVRWPLAVPTSANRAIRRSIATLDALLAQLFETTSARSSDDHPGFLRRLMTLGEGETGLAALARSRVRDEALTFLLAGYDTTSNALAWTAHLLATHPDVQAAVRRELREVCGDGPITLDQLQRLPQLSAAIDESLRLFPPVPVILRDVLADDELAGYTIPAGSVVAVLPYLAHRHPGYWDEPEAFVPERFVAAPPPPAYLPFGTQPRGCIGEQLALLWMKSVLASLLRRFSFRADPSFEVAADAQITLTPRNGLRLFVSTAADDPAAPAPGAPPPTLP